MASDWSYTNEILQCCYRVLWQTLQPQNYKELICLAELLCTKRIPSFSSSTRPVENIRNAMDEDNRFMRLNVSGKFGLSEWYTHTRQLRFLSYDEDTFLLIDGDIEIAKAAALEAFARKGSGMLNKYNDDVLTHYEKILTGFIIEHHLKAWFMRRYPDHYRPADNEGDYKKPSPNDWKLSINGTLLEFDAKKIGYAREAWVEASRLDRLRFFVIGEIENNRNRIRVDGFTTSRHLREHGEFRLRYFVLPEDELIPAKLLVVYINHYIQGLLADNVVSMPQMEAIL